ncbi:MAG TPA: nitrilase-related carbon-nitrogen hydrolase [Solirubrobacteraceae bacterium]|nr:nitrilase-related carbon-nitrogen hydrolase [Solirubrobacteraceae bacterium]
MAITASSPGGTRIACAQLAPVFGDVDGNRARAAEAVEGAARAGADLVVLPELCTTGYAFADESEACELGEAADGPTLAQWRALAAAHRVVIVGGFCELDAEGAPRNSALVVDQDGTGRVYRKTHLWDREQLIFVAGSQPPPVIDTSAGRVGVAICYDAFFPEVMRGLALAGADIIAVPMNSPLMGQPTAPLAAEVVLALASAQINRVYVVQADRTGPERGIRWANASAICDPDGRLLAGPVTGPATLQATGDLERARDKALGARNDVLADRRPHLYATTTKETVN